MRESEDGRLDEYVVDINADCVCGCMDGDRFHKIYRFPNGYGASVVNNPKKPGFNEDGYRILLLKFSSDEDYKIIREPMFDSNTLDCDSWDKTVGSLERIMELQKLSF